MMLKSRCCSSSMDGFPFVPPCVLHHAPFTNVVVNAWHWKEGIWCKGTLIFTFFTDRISPLHNSEHILSMQYPVRPTTSLVKPPSSRSPLPPSPFHRLVWLRDGSITGTQKRTPNTAEPYSVVSHCCNYHHCCAITIVLAVYSVGLVLAEAPSYSLWTSC